MRALWVIAVSVVFTSVLGVEQVRAEGESPCLLTSAERAWLITDPADPPETISRKLAQGTILRLRGDRSGGRWLPVEVVDDLGGVGYIARRLVRPASISSARCALMLRGHPEGATAGSRGPTEPTVLLGVDAAGEFEQESLGSSTPPLQNPVVDLPTSDTIALAAIPPSAPPLRMAGSQSSTASVGSAATPPPSRSTLAWLAIFILSGLGLWHVLRQRPDALWAMWRLPRRAKPDGPHLSVDYAYSLGPQQMVATVRYGNRSWLVGCSPTGVDCLRELGQPKSEVPEAVPAGALPEPEAESAEDPMAPARRAERENRHRERRQLIATSLQTSRRAGPSDGPRLRGDEDGTGSSADALAGLALRMGRLSRPSETELEDETSQTLRLA